MAGVAPQNGLHAQGVSLPMVARTPTKLPVKMPYILSKGPSACVLPGKTAVLKRKSDADSDDNAAVLGLAPSTKRVRREDQNRRSEAVSVSSSSRSSDSDHGEGSDNSSSSGSQSTNSSDSSSDRSSGDYDHSLSSTSSEDTGSESLKSGEELTLVQMAKAKGLVDKRADYTKEEQEVKPVGPPPRPPIVRSFPQNIDGALLRYEERLNREENMIRIKDDNKAVSLGTSKVNYIDPRIVCSWAREHNVPIGKIFSATLQKKFPWAMGAENFSF